jgi:hypothetical protein
MARRWGLEEEGVMSELIPVANTDDAGRVGDVVFVHGLGGNPRAYWMADRNKPETFWPAWIGADVAGVGVWSLGYDAAQFAWQGSAMPLFDRAKNALALLDADRIGDRPIVFITHSMGGLLVKQMIQHGLTLGDSRWKAITNQTRGVCFIATPHSGADLANYVKFLAKFLATIAVEDLKANAPQLRGLNEWYRNHAFSRFKTEVYCEKKVTGWKGLGVIVVDDRSADPGLPGVTPIPLDEDHLSICKPESRATLLYKRVLRFVKECLINPAHEVDNNFPLALYVGGAKTPPPGQMPTGPSAPAMRTVVISGKTKLAIAKQLVTRWPDLATYFEIPLADQEAFEKGHEPRRLMDWLDQRGRLSELRDAFNFLGWRDLIEELNRDPR